MKALRNILIVFVGMIVWSPAAFAADQSMVVGLGYVAHTFAEGDDFRKGTEYYGNADEISSAGGGEFFAELYLFDSIGVGFKGQTYANSVTYASSAGNLERKIEIGTAIVYATLSIPVGDDWRLGAMGGAGTSTYTVSVTWTPSEAWENLLPSTTVSETAEGSAGEVGVYADYGGAGSGVRFGFNTVAAEYPDIGSTTPQGSGSQLYIDYRYAF